MMRTLRYIAALAILSISVCWADDARSLYDQGKYAEALQQLEQSGMKTATDFYNAGNCYFKLGKFGQALSYYEKALSLSPGDADIRYNIKLAEANVEKRSARVKDQRFWMGTLIPAAKRVPESFADLLLALCTGALAVSAMQAKRKKLRFQQAIMQPRFLGVFGVWCLACSLTAAVVMAHHTKFAAVVADLSVARSGPNDTFTELFKLPAGSKVELTGEQREGWVQVRFSLGNVGWIMEKDLLSL